MCNNDHWSVKVSKLHERVYKLTPEVNIIDPWDFHNKEGNGSSKLKYLCSFFIWGAHQVFKSVYASLPRQDLEGSLLPWNSVLSGSIHCGEFEKTWHKWISSSACQTNHCRSSHSPSLTPANPTQSLMLHTDFTITITFNYYVILFLHSWIKNSGALG